MSHSSSPLPLPQGVAALYPGGGPQMNPSPPVVNQVASMTAAAMMPSAQLPPTFPMEYAQQPQRTQQPQGQGIDHYFMPILLWNFFFLVFPSCYSHHCFYAHHTHTSLLRENVGQLQVVRTIHVYVYHMASMLVLQLIARQLYTSRNVQYLSGRWQDNNKNG